MRWKLLGILACIAAVRTTIGALSYSINNGTATSLPIVSNTATVTLPSVVSGQVLLKVWSDQPTTEANFALVINGSVGTNPELQVLVAEQNAQFPQFTTSNVNVGANNLAGLTFHNTNPQQTDEDFRDISRVVVAINGQLTGPINCGQAFRIQARNGTSGSGSITAHAADGFAGFKACEVVTTSLGDVLRQGGTGSTPCHSFRRRSGRR